MRNLHRKTWITRCSAFLFCCTLLLGRSFSVQAVGKFVNRVFEDSTGKHKYSVYEPDGYSAKKKWPVVLFLHGAGERGTDGVTPSKVGLGGVLRQGKIAFPFVAVFPECEDLKSRYLIGWKAGTADAQRALKILAAVEKNYSIDTKRRILTGWSMGGYGVWSLAAATPKLWAGIVPVAGGGDAKKAAQLKDMPIWAFHGELDAAIKPSESREMAAAVRQSGGAVRLTIVKKARHDVWKTVYANSGLLAWMQNPKKTSNAEETALLVRPGQRPVKQANEKTPFVPAVEIPRAAYIRLGNKALKAMAYSVPSSVPPKMLSGRLGDIYDTTVTQGRNFNIQFSAISYSGSLDRAVIQAVGKNRLRIQLGLKNVTLNIGRTDVTGKSRSAVAGAINVVIGHQKPVWLSVDVAPYLKDRTVKLKLLSRSFSIPNGNWYVTSPAGVTTRGLGMTREKVSSGLVSGLYGSKARIEREIIAMVPKLVTEMEKKLVLTDVSKVIDGFWPLPVYQPRVRIWPSAIQTDKNGITLLLGVTAAAIDPKKAPRTPRQVAPLGPTIDKLPQGDRLEVGLAPGMMKPLMQMLAEADIARIHVLDIPEKKFATLADPKILVQAIPDLKRFGDDVEIWSELVLTRPLTVTAPKSGSPEIETSKKKTDDSKSESRRLTFQIPEVVISMAVRKKSQGGKWTPLAEFRFSISQDVNVALKRPNFTTRTIGMDWAGSPKIDVTGRFSPGYQATNQTLDAEKIRKLFTESWRAWTSKGPATRVDIPDLNFGTSGLRVNKIDWSSPFLSVTMGNPGIKISNSSTKPLVYQTKGPHSGWSALLTLKPDDSHEFNIPYSMTYRSTSNGRTWLYTLPVGSHSDYRSVKKGAAPQLTKAISKTK